jgi:hypothetical protein
MLKKFRSRIGVFLSLGYITFCLITVFALIVSPSDAMSGLAVIVVTLPWSLLFLELGAEPMGSASENITAVVGPILFVLIFIVSAMLNAVFLYFVGWSITRILITLGGDKK